MVLRFAAGYIHRCRSNGTAIWPSIMGEPLIFPMLVVLAVIWLLPHNPYPTKLKSVVMSHYNSLPSVHIDTHPSQTLLARYPANKTALYIEPREGTSFLVPLLLHMIMVVPPDWRFIFFGSSATVDQVRSSYTAAMYEGLGKLHVRNLEQDWGKGWARKGWEEKEKLSVDEMTNRLLTNKTFYDTELPGTEWLLTWHSDAILCANANVSLDDWLGWDWVGAPWNNGAKFGGNGGLAIRRVSKVREVLEFQQRQDNSGSEDQWMSSRLGLLPNAKMCPPEKEKEFAVEDIWHEWPMGYHMNHGGPTADVWRPVDRRNELYDYCPEIKIILDMNLEREKCPDQQDAERREGEDYRARIQQKQEEEFKHEAAALEKIEEDKKIAAEVEKKLKEEARIEAARKKLEEEEIMEQARKKLGDQKMEKAGTGQKEETDVGEPSLNAEKPGKDIQDEDLEDFKATVEASELVEGSEFREDRVPAEDEDEGGDNLVDTPSRRRVVDISGPEP